MRFSQLTKKLMAAAVWLAALLPAVGAPEVSAQDAGQHHSHAEKPTEAPAPPSASPNPAAPGGHGVARHARQLPAASMPDSIYVGAPVPEGSEVVTDEVRSIGDSLQVVAADTIPVADLMPEPIPDLTPGEAMVADSVAAAANAKPDEWVRREVEFTPNPTRAVWLSALFPGLGQIYNRRYWKLPIIVGGYMGLGYAVSWNNTMLTDYTRAYADLLDNDPSSNSYMDFFAPNVNESDIDKSWLQSLLRSRKNFFRRNRDLCIISMVGVYLLAMVDAYVDASLSHFDINPHLSMDVVPTLIQDGRQRYPSVGLAWALNF